MTTVVLPFTCEACGVKFGPLSGGACSRCGRVLCQMHLQGEVPPRRWFRSDPPLCVECRSREQDESLESAQA